MFARDGASLAVANERISGFSIAIERKKEGPNPFLSKTQKYTLKCFS